jgi:hypothetical protein
MTKPRRGETFRRCRLGYAPLGLVPGLACHPMAYAVGYRSSAALRLLPLYASFFSPVGPSITGTLGLAY